MNLEYGALHVALVGDRDGGTMALNWPESLRPFIPVACLKTTQREDTNYAWPLGHFNVKSENVCKITICLGSEMDIKIDLTL